LWEAPLFWLLPGVVIELVAVVVAAVVVIEAICVVCGTAVDAVVVSRLAVPVSPIKSVHTYG